MKVLNFGVREAKINLSRLLKMVKDGKEVVITDRGKPVGKIIPLAYENLPLAERILQMEKQGWIEPLKNGVKGSLPPPLPAPDGIAQKFLQEERNS